MSGLQQLLNLSGVIDVDFGAFKLGQNMAAGGSVDIQWGGISPATLGLECNSRRI